MSTILPHSPNALPLNTGCSNPSRAHLQRWYVRDLSVSTMLIGFQLMAEEAGYVVIIPCGFGIILRRLTQLPGKTSTIVLIDRYAT